MDKRPGPASGCNPVTGSREKEDDTMPITEEERQSRMRALKGAGAINAIGGGPISDYAKQLSIRWANGEITLEEMKEALLEHHKRKAESGPQHCQF